MTDWTCPICGRRLLAPRVAHLGCMGLLRAVGECAMHRTVTPRLPDAELARHLAAGPHIVKEDSSPGVVSARGRR